VRRAVGGQLRIEPVALSVSLAFGPGVLELLGLLKFEALARLINVDDTLLMLGWNREERPASHHFQVEAPLDAGVALLEFLLVHLLTDIVELHAPLVRSGSSDLSPGDGGQLLVL